MSKQKTRGYSAATGSTLPYAKMKVNSMSKSLIAQPMGPSNHYSSIKDNFAFIIEGKRIKVF